MQFPRPGLMHFLEQCRVLVPRGVTYTTVREERFRTIAAALVAEGSVPAWFETMEYVNWKGRTKDLAFIPDADLDGTWLIDDSVTTCTRDRRETGYRSPSSRHPTLLPMPNSLDSCQCLRERQGRP